MASASRNARYTFSGVERRTRWSRIVWGMGVECGASIAACGRRAMRTYGEPCGVSTEVQCVLCTQYSVLSTCHAALKDRPPDFAVFAFLCGLCVKKRRAAVLLRPRLHPRA